MKNDKKIFFFDFEAKLELLKKNDKNKFQKQ